MGLKMHAQARRDVLQQMAPQYREASVSHKGELLDVLVTQTGYARRYVMWLLNHPTEEASPRSRTRRCVYGTDVQQALYLLWHTNNRLCTKRLIPFLPTLIDALERHGHLHLTEECRRQLLSMSAATADRILASLKKQGQYGLSTTQAGTYLKSQIPLRTFTDWDNTCPGYLQADLVSHCGSQREGSSLYTLTLTDIATTWTECVPLLHRSPEAVLAAFERVRTRFPFPILGLDTDNGGEFINEKLFVYCERDALHHQKSYYPSGCETKGVTIFLLVVRVVHSHFSLFEVRNGESTMKRSGKNLGDAYHAVAVVATPGHAHSSQHRRKMGVGLSMRRELLKQFAPQYHEASSANKRVVLTDFVRLTGYHRKYAISLLHKPPEELQTVERPSRCVYGSDVGKILVQVWEQSNCVCSKRLIPFLPTVLEAMERHGHLHLTPECRQQVLAISTATADRLLRPHRQRVTRGLCTTRAGTLLKSTIPIRTFEQWDEQVPGFVEVDLVAHCGSSVEGTYLFTLTLTDIATGWTECLPLLSKSAEAVLAALQHARTLFPFPLLGLDTDNGTEFMNDLLLNYCEQEQITFTRGRPLLKNDQCYVEQKNGHLVRQVVGYDRFVGTQAYQHLDDLYRVLSPYVNSFQPSMKLCAKLKEGRRVRRIYDEAKTPLMRLLQAQALSAEHECDLSKQFEDLDPVRLLEQAQQAQQTLFRGVVSVFPQSEKTRRLGGSERFRIVGRSRLPSVADAVSRRALGTGREEEELSATPSLLEWHRTCNDPFQEQWEVIAQWVSADPTRSCRAMFEELRRLSPDHYQPSHLRTLQRGVRKIRARLQRGVQHHNDGHDANEATSLVSAEEHELQQDAVHDLGVSTWKGGEEHTHNDDVNEHAGSAILCSCAVVSAHAPSFSSFLDAQEEPASVREPSFESASLKPSAANREHVLEITLVSDFSVEPIRASKNPMSITIEEAIGDYLVAQQQAKRRPKTMEWHQTALGLFGQYLRTECQCVLLAEMTERHVQGWLESLHLPTSLGVVRSEGTRHSYARSARAWCQWLVNAGSLTRTPFAEIALVRVEPPVMHPLEREEWKRLLLACESPGEHGVIPEWAPARNRALLWVLYDTGMRLSEVCALRLGDVDLDQEMLMVRRDTFKGRRLPLGHEALEAVRVYVEQYRVSGRRADMERGVSDKPLFLSETGQELTENGIVSMFGCLRERAGLTREEIGPTLVRDSFAVRYLQAGGDMFTLRDLLGYQESVAVRRFLRMSNKETKNDKRGV